MGSVYIYIYIYMCVCVCVCGYIYIYIMDCSPTICREILITRQSTRSLPSLGLHCYQSLPLSLSLYIYIYIGRAGSTDFPYFSRYPSLFSIFPSSNSKLRFISTQSWCISAFAVRRKRSEKVANELVLSFPAASCIVLFVLLEWFVRFGLVYLVFIRGLFNSNANLLEEQQ